MLCLPTQRVQSNKYHIPHNIDNDHNKLSGRLKSHHNESQAILHNERPKIQQISKNRWIPNWLLIILDMDLDNYNYHQIYIFCDR